jgi:hypothetical protein
VTTNGETLPSRALKKNSSNATFQQDHFPMTIKMPKTTMKEARKTNRLQPSSFMNIFFALVLLASCSNSNKLLCQAYVSPLQQNQKSQRYHGRMIGLKTQQKQRSPDITPTEKKEKKLCMCPQDNDQEPEADEDWMESRREMLFATLGSLWAASATMAFPDPAHAVAGTDAKMAFPDVMQGLSDRNSKQCLVETLGNRECLVYKEDDPDKLLYKGADAQVLLGRIQTAASALQNIPPLVDTKQWNKITGILTGPMGQTSATLTLLCNGIASDQKKAVAQKAAQKVKQDLFAMGTATQQRNTNDIMKYQELAIQDFDAFVSSFVQ